MLKDLVPSKPFLLTLLAQALGAALVLLSQLPQSPSVAVALVVVGAAVNVLSVLGYQAGAARVKAAEAQAEALKSSLSLPPQ